MIAVQLTCLIIILTHGLVTLNLPTFKHATVNHRPVIDCAFSNTPIETDDEQDVHDEHHGSAIFVHRNVVESL